MGRQHRRVRVLLVVVAVVLAGGALAGCGDDTPTTPDAGDASASPVADADASPDEPTPSSTPSGEPTDEPTPDDDGEPALPGEPYDGPPVSGAPAELAVVGVAVDDVLNVRAAPGTDQDVVATLDPLAAEVQATGRARALTSSIWLELEVDGTTGWAASAFLAHRGATTDITAELRDQGPLPNAETLLQLADAVAALRASQDPQSRIVVSDGPSVGDLGEVTVDVVGLGDDAVFAERLVVFATEDDSGEGFTVRTVEATEFCGRGLSEDGLCA